MPWATTLQELNLIGNPIEILAGVNKFLQLRSLRVSNSHLSRISGLDTLRKLKNLDLSMNYIEVIENLNSLDSLEYLYLGDNKIKRLTGLGNLRQLKMVDLSNNMIDRITEEELGSLPPGLADIQLFGMKVDLPPDFKKIRPLINIIESNVLLHRCSDVKVELDPNTKKRVTRYRPIKRIP